MLFSSLILWSCIFSEPPVFSYKFTFLILFLVLGFNSLNRIISGWSTFRKFSLIGRIRTVSQLISYEPVLYILIFFFLFLFRIFNLYNLRFLFFSLALALNPLFFYIWVPSVLAELNRTPFDFSEGERELVRGFNTEFGSSCFTAIFLAEYRNIIFLSLISSFLFFQRRSFIRIFYFFIIFLFFILWIRSVLPRFRYDKLIYLAWKFYIPLTTLVFSTYLVMMD